MNDLIDQLGGTVDSVIVNNLENDTYYARIKVKCKDQIIEIDSRPSDAIALSVRTKSPIAPPRATRIRLYSAMI